MTSSETKTPTRFEAEEMEPVVPCPASCVLTEPVMARRVRQTNPVINVRRQINKHYALPEVRDFAAHRQVEQSMVADMLITAFVIRCPACHSRDSLRLTAKSAADIFVAVLMTAARDKCESFPTDFRRSVHVVDKCLLVVMLYILFRTQRCC